MEEIIQRLQELSEPVPVPLDLPEEDDLLNVEEALFLQLPKDYRLLLQEAGDVVIGDMELASACDPSSHIYIPELAAELWSTGLPRHLIPIAVQAETTYVLDPDGQVMSWAGSLDQDGWESVWDWAEQVWIRHA